MELLKVSLGFRCGLCVDSIGRTGDIAMFWADKVSLIINNFSSHHIDAHIEEEDTRMWWISGFYVHPKSALRWGSWNLLHTLSKRSQHPWL